MTASVVAIAPDDLDHVESCPTTKALANLAEIHQLPPYVALYRAERADGRISLVVAVEQHTAEQWRAALGAAPFTSQLRPTSTQHTTEAFWFGAIVRLSFSTAE